MWLKAGLFGSWMCVCWQDSTPPAPSPQPHQPPAQPSPTPSPPDPPSPVPITIIFIISIISIIFIISIISIIIFIISIIIFIIFIISIISIIIWGGGPGPRELNNLNPEALSKCCKYHTKTEQGFSNFARQNLVRSGCDLVKVL